MLTPEKVEKFLGVTLGIEDWESKLEASKLNFFLEFNKKFKQTIYYQNFSYAVPETLVTPTKESSIYEVTETAGAACIQMNYFVQALLEHLGYDSFLVSAPHVAISHPNNHMVVITRVPVANEGTRPYMVDMGLPWPIPEPVDLNNLPHVTHAGGFKLVYRFNEEKQLFERVLVGGDPVKVEGAFENLTEELADISFDLTPLKFEDFTDAMSITFTERKATFFLNTGFTFRFLSLESREDFEYVVCFARSIIVGRANSGHREIMTYESYGEMVEDILMYFPNLDRTVVTTACGRFDKRRESEI